MQKILDQNISGKLGNDNALKTQIQEMNNEISMLKKGIIESIDDLDEIIGEEDARS